MPEGTKLGPVGSEVIYENDLVRVWSLRLPAGATQDWHRHDLDYLVIPIVPSDNNVMVFADGREKPTTETPGDALWRQAGPPHKLENRGTIDYQNVLVEFKKS
ncbi:hypothetical protein IT41_19310 [Paracoccus halophilus]|nr:hypothetical protein IT41_19310 [Paracoccus halophilus]